jgi:co-chaperonin GroES (HSP10)
MITRKIIPLGDMVLLKAIRADRTQGGVAIPDEAQAKRSLGHMVIDIGEEVERVSLSQVYETFRNIKKNWKYFDMRGKQDVLAWERGLWEPGEDEKKKVEKIMF